VKLKTSVRKNNIISGGIMDPEKLMNDLSKELSIALKAMAKAKTPEEKLQYSEIVKNLCESLGVFLGLISDMAPYGFDDNEEI
jgi:hypothetical protein